MKNDKIAKVCWIINVILLLIIVVLSIVSTIFMFSDFTGVKLKNVTNNRSLSHPESGVMPLIATIALIGAVILLISAKKKPVRAIGTLVLVFVAQTLLSLSVLASAGSYNALTGWTFGIIASSIGFIVFVMTIVYVALAKNPLKQGPGTRATICADLDRMAQNLKQIKDLYDGGIFSEDEFRSEKEALLRANGIMGSLETVLNGVYANMNSKIAISDNVFSMTYEGRVVKVGTIEKIGEKEIGLRSEDGKELLMTISGSTLVTQTGIRYEKE